jgi:hypothetical protein
VIPLLDYETHASLERYASANRQLLEVTDYLMSRLKDEIVTTKMAKDTIDELLQLIRLVNHNGARENKLRKSIYTEVIDFAERVLPDHS